MTTPTETTKAPQEKQGRTHVFVQGVHGVSDIKSRMSLER